MAVKSVYLGERVAANDDENVEMRSGNVVP